MYTFEYILVLDITSSMLSSHSGRWQSCTTVILECLQKTFKVLHLQHPHGQKSL